LPIKRKENNKMRSLKSNYIFLFSLIFVVLFLVGCGGDDSSNNGKSDKNIPIPLLFTDNGDGTITDDITGLMWQKNDDDQIYSWGEAVGTTDVGVCEGLDLGGFSDWRVPTLKELLSIVVFERYDPAIDTEYFPDTLSSAYWTLTEYSGGLNKAYRVEFNYGVSHTVDKGYEFYIRCVRGTTIPSPSFSNNGNGTITDSTTGYMWQQDTGPLLLLEDSKQYCADLILSGYEDWRMPSIRELITIVDHTTNNPAVDIFYFPNTYSDTYSSSSNAAPFDGSNRWAVNFWYGSNGLGGGSQDWVRCVRGE
jgi:hypothetical protein